MVRQPEGGGEVAALDHQGRPGRTPPESDFQPEELTQASTASWAA